jgi:microcystin-dependent protein
MSDPFLGEIIMFGGNFAPRGWATCSGQILPIAQNTALFSILGTTYGGNGQTTFALPDMRGRVPTHFGQGPGLSSYSLGEQGGSESGTLNINQMPPHTHAFAQPCVDDDATVSSASGKVPANAPNNIYAAPSGSATMAGGNTGIAGGGQPHDLRQPYLCVNFIIALEGIFPSRN